MSKLENQRTFVVTADGVAEKDSLGGMMMGSSEEAFAKATNSCSRRAFVLSPVSGERSL